MLASELEQADHGLEAAAVRVEGDQLGEGEAGLRCWATPLGLAGLNGSLQLGSKIGPKTKVGLKPNKRIN